MLGPVLSQDFYYAAGSRNLNVYNFHTPEQLFSVIGGNADIDWEIVNDQDKIRLETYLTPTHTGATFPGLFGNQVETTNFHYYQKWYTDASPPAGASAKGDERTITNNLNLAFGVVTANYFNTGRTFSQLGKMTAGAVDDNSNSITLRESRGMPSVILGVSGAETNTSGFGAVDVSNRQKALCSIMRPTGDLYGGQGESALANTTYIYAGHYQEINSSVLSDIVDGSGNYIFNGIEVFGGDTFLNLFDISRMVKDNGAEDDGTQDQISHTIVFPVESEINIAYRQGRHVGRDGSWENNGGTIINPEGVAYTTSSGVPPGATPGPAQPENFIYNSAYSADDNSVAYPALPTNFVSDAEKINRIVYSNEKVLGEVTDSWRQFAALNFKDIEAQNGQINNIRYKANRMLYWQHGGVGFLSVNERVVVGDVLGAETRLGVGGILDRYDERTRYYGNQNQHSLIELATGFVWFDNVNKSFCWMNTGGELIEMNTAKGLQNFFEQTVVGPSVLTDNPIISEGISGVYDGYNKEVLMTFKIENPNVPPGTTIEVGDYYGYAGLNYVCTTGFTTPGSTSPDPADYPNNFELVGPSEFTIGFLDSIRKFSSFYTFYPTTSFNADGITLQATEGLKPVILGSRDYVVGDQVSEGNNNYVAKNDFTSAATPVQPSVDTTNWELVSNVQEVYQHDIGDICKFYGVVFDAFVKPVLNNGREVFKTFDNYMHIGNEEMFTTLEYETSYQKIVENDVDQIYKFLNRSWRYGTPLLKGARLRDYYLIIKAIKDNKDEDASTPITTSLNKVIKLVSMNMSFRPSK